MKKELQEKLFNDFPLLYKEKDLPATQTCMCWGITCGPGWFDILYELSEKIYPYILKWIEDNPDDKDNHPRAVQVKEKFGTLRFYMRGGNEEIYNLINEAEHKTFEVCETCGAPGERRTEGWIFTLCDECEDLRHSDRKAFHERLNG